MTVTQLRAENLSITTSVQRALQILDCFRVSGPHLGVTEVARLAGLPKSTAFRLLSSMIACGYIERVGSMYRLGPSVFELGARASNLDPQVRESILPLLIDLSTRTGYTVHLGVLQGSDVLYVEKIPGRAAPRTPTTLGARMPTSCTALGKVLLAHSQPRNLEAVVRSPLVRRTPYSVIEPRRLVGQVGQAKVDGFAQDREEAALGLTCIAAPLLHGARAWAGLSLSGPPALLRNRALQALVPDVARQVSAMYSDHLSHAAVAANA